MARPQTVTQTGVGSSGWNVVNPHISPFEVYFDCVTTGTVTTYAIDLTLQSPLQTLPWDQVGGGSPASPTIDTFNPSGFSGLNTSTTLTLNDPVFAWRITIPSGGGTGSVRVTALQAGIRGE